jgi:hypothetical protein
MRQPFLHEQLTPEGARRAFLMMGQVFFGPPDAAVLQAVNCIADPLLFMQLVRQFFRARSWQELFQTCDPKRPFGER